MLMFGMAIWKSNAQALAESQVKAQQGRDNMHEVNSIQTSGTATPKYYGVRDCNGCKYPVFAYSSG